MGQSTITAIVTIIVAVIGVAIVAVVVSKASDTGNVITAGGNALTNILKTAVSPLNQNSGGLPPLTGLNHN